MSLRMIAVVGLSVFTWSSVALADVVSDEMLACQNKKDDEACVLPGGGGGVCVRMKDFRRDNGYLDCVKSAADVPKDRLFAPSAKPNADVVVPPSTATPTSAPTATPTSTSTSTSTSTKSGCSVGDLGAGSGVSGALGLGLLAAVFARRSRARRGVARS